MEIKKGTTRIVIIFSCFVLKFPVIKWKYAYTWLKDDIKYYIKFIISKGFKRFFAKMLIIKRNRARNNKKRIIEDSEALGLKILPLKSWEYMGTNFFLISGVMANWYEFIFYFSNRNLFVMPTYFSFFGLVNIQKKGEKINFWNNNEIRNYICANSVNEDQIFCDSHTFVEIENFGLDGDKIKMLDYGSRHVHNFLRLNGNKLFNNFIKPPV